MKVAVYGIWFTVSQQQESAFFKSLFASVLPQTPEDVISITNLDFLSLNTQITGKDYFAYRGSMTTPPCTYGVLWTLPKTFLPISQDQIDIIRALQSVTPRNSTEGDNNRPVQPIITALSAAQSRKKY